MFEPDGYPIGTYRDPIAPWNEKINLIPLEITVFESVAKKLYVAVNDKKIDQYECTDSFLNNNYLPSDLINKFKECLEYYLNNKKLQYSDKEIKSLIKDCEGWKSENFDIDL